MSKMKKILSALMTVTLIVGMLLVPVAGATEEKDLSSVLVKTTIVKDNFDNVADGAVASPTNGGVVAITVTTSEGAAVFNNTRHTTTVSGVPAKTAVEFDIKAPASVVNATNRVSADEQIMSLVSASNTKFVHFYWGKGALRVGGTIFDGRYVDLPKITESWHTYKMLLDFDENKAYVYGGKRGTELSLLTTLNITASAAGVQRLNNNSVLTGTALDNISVYEYVETDKRSAVSAIADARTALALAKVENPAMTFETGVVDAFEAEIIAAEEELQNTSSPADVENIEKAMRRAYSEFVGKGTPSIVNVRAVTTPHSAWSADTVTVDEVTGWKVDARYANNMSHTVQGGNTYIYTTSFLQTEKETFSKIMYVMLNPYSSGDLVFSVSSDGTNLNLLYGQDTVGTTDNTGVSAVLVENYDVNTWYNIKAVVDMPTETIKMYVNGEPVLADYTLYCVGANVGTKTSYNSTRIDLDGRSKSYTYMANREVFIANTLSLVNAFTTLNDSVSNIGAERIELPATVRGYDVEWTVEGGYTVENNVVQVSDSTVDCEGALTATITVGNKAYSETFVLNYTSGGLKLNYSLLENGDVVNNISNVTGTDAVAGIAISNDSNVVSAGVILVAVYDNDKAMMSVKIVNNIALEPGEYRTVTVPVELPAEKTGVCVKVFYLESLSALKPLYPAYSYAQ